MKGLLCAGLLAWLQAMTAAHAYDADIHYSTTYVLARAVGWTEAEAQTIASANQAMDENQDTVAALEMHPTPSPSFAGYLMNSFHQAEKNLKLHCFSNAPGKEGGISADVRETIAGHFAGVSEDVEDARSNSKRLIALGTALHCQQDAHSHAGFGGSCGSHSGSCYGHAYETVLDQVVFALVKKHRFNPDHPAVSGERILESLQGTVRELAARRPGNSSRQIPTGALIALSDALRGSGLELPDEVRVDCNRHIAGKWLHDFVNAGDGLQVATHTVEKLAPEVAGTCRNASLASATVIRIPAPRFPRLRPDASPYQVRTDGTYQLIHDAETSVSLPGIGAERIAGLITNYNARKPGVQLSHWSQLLALPLMSRVALLSADSSKDRRHDRHHGVAAT